LTPKAEAVAIAIAIGASKPPVALFDIAEVKITVNK
jgi:hypothetical protein